MWTRCVGTWIVGTRAEIQKISKVRSAKLYRTDIETRTTNKC